MANLKDFYKNVCLFLGLFINKSTDDRTPSCTDPESFIRGGPTIGRFFVLFLVDEGRKDPNTTEIWPSPACKRNAIDVSLAG